MERSTKRLTQTLGAVGIAAGLGLGAAGLASAVTTPAPPSSSYSTAATTRSNDGADSGKDQKDPQLNGSIQIPEQKGENDAAEAAALKTAAKISPEQAKQSALAAVPGTAGAVELGNENGSVVYDVEVTANGVTTDVTVDAGNGKVLARETGESGGHDATDTTKESATEKPGTEPNDNKSGSEKPGTENNDSTQPANGNTTG